MISKKLLTLIIVIAVLAVIFVVFAGVFSVRLVLPVYHSFEGGVETATDDAPTADDVLQLCKGKNILFLSKQEVIDQLNEKYPDWHAIGIVKNFPNILEVHFVKRVAVVSLKVDGASVYLDSFGYVVETPSADETPQLDITSAFEGTISKNSFSQNSVGKMLVFNSDTNNQRLSCVLESIMALWQCECEIENIPAVLGITSQNSDGTTPKVFTFDDSGAMIITTGVGAKIYIMDPTNTLTDKLINAFSAYCSDGNMQSGVVFEVYPDGRINKK